jgi:DNA-binding response OmpR family regulator
MDENLNRYDLLVVDDDSDVRELLTEFFRQKGYSVIAASHGAEYKKLYRDNLLRLVIMDIEMPGESGIELLRWTQQQPNSIPMLLLSANNRVEIKIKGLSIGADDYLVKPFEPRELLARVEVILRREPQQATHCIAFSGYQYFLSTKLLMRDAHVVKLTTAEEELLAILCEQPNKVLSREYITQRIKGYDHDPFDRTIDIRVTRLRKKLQITDSSVSGLKTIRGKGYQLLVDEF